MKQLNLVEKAFFLKKTALFCNLDLDLLIAIADKMNQDIYDPKETVFEYDQRASRMYLIVSGCIGLYDENQNLLAKLKEEEFFGDEALFNDTPRTYSAICETKTLFLTLSKPNLMNVISECPQIAISLMQFYAKNTPCRHTS